MITKDQPNVFPDTVIAAVSSINNGNMKYPGPVMDQPAVDENRANFLSKLGIRPEQTVLVRTTYDGSNYNRYHTVGENNRGQGMVRPSAFNSDSLATNQKNVAIFLPIADCIGGFVYDPVLHSLMVMHLGRQATEQLGATKSIEFMAREFGSEPEDMLVWLGPAPSEKTYPVFSLDNRSLHDVNTEHLISAGVNPKNITVCNVDTILDTNYFSHSEFLKGRREADGRYAIVGMLK
jgi:purine-nucleoside/S-methyl-5'-thioadenosine phosphorylase / adenosine deaminase